MTGETAAELRARLGALTEAGHPMASRAHMKFAVALVNAWPDIDGMLARLAAAEADADRLFPIVRTVITQDRSITGHVEAEAVMAIRAHEQALALRDPR